MAAWKEKHGYEPLLEDSASASGSASRDSPRWQSSDVESVWDDSEKRASVPNQPWPVPLRRAGNAVTHVVIVLFLVVALLLATFKLTNRPDKGCPYDFSIAGRAETIQCLLAEGGRRGAVLESGQSRTLAAAQAEYKRRYQRDVPDGFADWFEWNREHDGAIVDDFDQVEANLAPFRTMTVAKLEDAVARVTDRFFPLLTVNVTDGNMTFPEYPWFSNKGSMKTLAPIMGKLPNMHFVHNIEDYDKVRGPMYEDYKTTQKLGFDEVEATDAWQFYTAPCPRVFVPATSYAGRPSFNLCSAVNNSYLADNRASLHGPTKGIVNLIPMFSWAKYATSRDIVIPRPAYAGDVDRGWDKGPDNLSFAEKNATFYWRGSTTGRSMMPSVWRTNHRVRFVHYMANFKAAQQRLRAHGCDFEAAEVHPLYHQLENTPDSRQLFMNLPEDTFDVGFSHRAQCQEGNAKGDESGCDDLFKEVPLMQSKPMMEERNHQFVADIDGNSMSGRFYRMLESNSVVFKETLFAEWHDDRLVPWYHYIPMEQQTHQHIPAILDYFINDAQGRRDAAAIAANGRRAAERSLKVEDQSAYWYRVLIEYRSLFTRKEM